MKKDTNESFDLKNTTKYKRVGEYQSSKVKIEFLCPECNNIWLIRPNDILSKYGCANCATHKSKKYTNEEFDSELVSKGIKYTRVSNYINNHTKLTMQCNKCSGLWDVIPNSILSSLSNCPSCSISGFKENKDAYLYFIQIEDFLKVGITNREPIKRYKELTNKEVIEIKVIRGSGKYIKNLEDKIHRNFKHFYPKEKLKSGNTECFPLSLKNEILSHIT